MYFNYYCVTFQFIKFIMNFILFFLDKYLLYIILIYLLFLDGFILFEFFFFNNKLILRNLFIKK